MSDYLIRNTKFLGSYTFASVLALMVDTSLLLFLSSFFSGVTASLFAYLSGAMVAFYILRGSSSIEFKGLNKLFFRSALYVFLMTGVAGLIATFSIFNISIYFGFQDYVLLTKAVAVVCSFLLTLFLRVLFLLGPAKH
jgi:hypothetical protein